MPKARVTRATTVNIGACPRRRKTCWSALIKSNTSRIALKCAKIFNVPQGAKGLSETGRSSEEVDRRLHNRVLADLDVEVIRLKRAEESVSGRIEDVSESGLCIIL